MTKKATRAVARLRERLEESDELSAEDAETLQEFSDQLYRREYTDERHKFHLMRLVKLGEEVGGLTAALSEQDALDDHLEWMRLTHPREETPETHKGYRVAIRMFGEHAPTPDGVETDQDGKPMHISRITATYPSSYDPAPDPSDMLRWDEDVRPMIDACHNMRDKALVALAWDLGPRAGELQDITVGSVTDHEYGLQVTLNGKTGRRSPVIVPAVPFVNQWLQVHPGRKNGDAPLWSKLSSSDSISGRMVRKALEEPARRAGVTRPVTPTNFRKSSASHLASQGVSQAHLEDHHGWVRGSKVASRYIAVFDDASERAIARAHGVDVSEDEPEPTGPVTCHRCNRQTPRDEPTCVFCGQALSHAGLETAREQNKTVRQDTATASGNRAEALAELGDLFDQYPFLREAAGGG